MTIWSPHAAELPGPLYRRVAKALEEDIVSGRLPAGARLPTHRQLASALGTTVVTASRAYREAAQWGLIQGEVGRGTFVLARPSTSAAVLRIGHESRPTAERELVDLTENYISAGFEAAGAHRRAAADLLWETLQTRVPPGGTRAQRAAGATWMSGGAFAPRPEQIVITAGAQHAIAAALGALGRPGELLYLESLTYPGVKAAAHHLGLRLQPVPVDALGLVPEALADLCARHSRGQREAAGAGAAAGGVAGATAGAGGILYCQPSLHNPTCAVMPAERRLEIAAIARRYDLAIVEDNPYGFLLADPPPPLAALAPERTCHVVTCSKALAVGLRVGYLAAPELLAPKVQAEAAASCLGISLVELATRWIVDGTAHRITAAKRREAELRQQLAQECLARGGRLTFASHPRSSHLWLELPRPWRVGPFVEQARRRGVAVNPSESFVAAHDAAAPHAVRICLGPPADRDRLERALHTLADLLTSAPPPEAPVV